MTSDALEVGIPAPSAPLLDLLACPKDHTSPLRREDDALACPACGTRFPVRDGIVSFLSAQEISDKDDRERAMRDEESAWYDGMFEGYTNAVEVPTAVRRVGQPQGPILDAGCGTGRVTEALLALGQPIIAVDYSEGCLRHMQARTTAGAVLAVQADLRTLPVRTNSMAAATSIEVYAQLRRADRPAVLASLSRALQPGAPLSISAYNYNLMFRFWALLGNEGAREGEHMLGNDYYYYRFREAELRKELEAVFDVEELTGIRNIPARTLAQALRRARLRVAGDRFLDYMVRRGHAADFAIERVPLVAGAIGFFWQATCRARPARPG